MLLLYNAEDRGTLEHQISEYPADMKRRIGASSAGCPAFYLGACAVEDLVMKEYERKRHFRLGR